MLYLLKNRNIFYKLPRFKNFLNWRPLHTKKVKQNRYSSDNNLFDIEQVNYNLDYNKSFWKIICPRNLSSNLSEQFMKKKMIIFKLIIKYLLQIQDV